MVTPAWVNKEEPEDKEIELVIQVAGLREFKPMYFPRGEVQEEERPARRRRPPLSIRRKWVGPYLVEMERRPETCMLRLWVYSFKDGSLRLKGTWSGYEPVLCDRQFLKTVDTATAAIMRRTLRKA